MKIYIPIDAFSGCRTKLNESSFSRPLNGEIIDFHISSLKDLECLYNSFNGVLANKKNQGYEFVSIFFDENDLILSKKIFFILTVIMNVHAINSSFSSISLDIERLSYSIASYKGRSVENQMMQIEHHTSGIKFYLLLCRAMGQPIFNDLNCNKKFDLSKIAQNPYSIFIKEKFKFNKDKKFHKLLSKTSINIFSFELLSEFFNDNQLFNQFNQKIENLKLSEMKFFHFLMEQKSVLNNKATLSSQFISEIEFLLELNEGSWSVTNIDPKNLKINTSFFSILDNNAIKINDETVDLNNGKIHNKSSYYVSKFGANNIIRLYESNLKNLSYKINQ